MNDRELIAALRRLKVQTGSLACLGCGQEHNCSTSGCAIIREAIKALRDAPWISVKDRLPKDRGNVLVVAFWHERWDVYMGWCAPKRSEWSVHIGIGDRSDVAVSHWMPLPEPPEEGQV